MKTQNFFGGEGGEKVVILLIFNFDIKVLEDADIFIYFQNP